MLDEVQEAVERLALDLDERPITTELVVPSIELEGAKAISHVRSVQCTSRTPADDAREAHRGAQLAVSEVDRLLGVAGDLDPGEHASARRIEQHAARLNDLAS